jgi:hypothetical protein
MYEITIQAERGEFLKITLFGRSHPESDDYWDGNWVRASIQVQAGGFSGDAVGDIRTDELAAFQKPWAQLQTSLEGVAEFSTLEEWLAIRATGDGKGHIEVQGVVWDRPGVGNNLQFTLSTDQTFTRPTIDQLAEAIRAFPVIGRR